MTDRLEILRRVRDQAPHGDALLAETWLTREDTAPLGEAPSEITVEEASSLWRLRSENLMGQGKVLLGADAFLAALSELNPKKKLLQFSFKNEDFNGSAFFEKHSGQYAGIIIKPTREGSAVPKTHTSVQYA